VKDSLLEQPIWADQAEEYSKNCQKFYRNAEVFAKKYGEKLLVD
jgi:hypothetical protein